MEAGAALTTTADDGLPDFEKPPVVETVLSVQFREVKGLDTALLIKYWRDYLEAELPTIEERSRYEPPIEQFGPNRGTSTVDFQIGAPPTSPRLFCSGSNHLVQLQVDWFAYNWRKVADSPEYARYEKGRAKFESWISKFETFLQSSLNGSFIPTQCEVSYINHILLTQDDIIEGPFGTVFKSIQPRAGEFLPDPENARYIANYLINGEDRPAGRLHITADQASIGEDLQPILLLSLTARGLPISPDLAGVLGFLDIGRRWVVKGFVDLTSSLLHQRWGLNEIQED